MVRIIRFQYLQASALLKERPFVEIWVPNNGVDLLRLKVYNPGVHTKAIQDGMFRIDELTRVTSLELKYA